MGHILASAKLHVLLEVRDSAQDPCQSADRSRPPPAICSFTVHYGRHPLAYCGLGKVFGKPRPGLEVEKEKL